MILPLALLPLLAAVLCACGVSTQSRPVPLPLRTPASGAALPTAGTSAQTLYFVRDTRLEAVHRTGAPGGLPATLDLLAGGPTAKEAQGGLRTALAPQQLTVLGLDPIDRTLTLGVTRQFTAVTGGNQLLAVAQVVWTATRFPGVRRVRFLNQNAVLEVPTDHGLTDQPVAPGDYGSLAPTAAPSAASPGPGG